MVEVSEADLSWLKHLVLIALPNGQGGSSTGIEFLGCFPVFVSQNSYHPLSGSSKTWFSHFFFPVCPVSSFLKMFFSS